MSSAQRIQSYVRRPHRDSTKDQRKIEIRLFDIIAFSSKADRFICFSEIVSRDADPIRIHVALLPRHGSSSDSTVKQREDARPRSRGVKRPSFA